MTLEFACPHCGKEFRVRAALAGKTCRCGGCGGRMTLPEAAPGADVYDLGTPSTGPARDADDRPGRAAPPPFGPGTKIDILTVDECSPDRLVLSYRTFGMVARGLLGVLALVLGLAVLYAPRANAGNPAKPEKSLIWGILLVGFGSLGVACLARLGRRLTFDRRSKTLTIRRFDTSDRTWAAGDLGGLVYSVSKATWERSPLHNDQVCDLRVIDRGGLAIAELGHLGPLDKKSTVRSAEAAIHAARLLGLPVYTDVQGEPKSDPVRRALGLIEGSGVRERWPRGTRVREPILSPFRLAGIAGTALIAPAMIHWFLTPDAPAPAGVAGPVNPAPPPARVRAAEARRIEARAEDMRSPVAGVRRMAAADLADVEPVAGPRREAIRARLVAMVEGDDLAGRREALKALGRWGTVADLPLLIEGVRDPDRATRESAAEALARRKDARGAAALVERMHVPDDRFTMTMRLIDLGPAAAPAVLPLLDDPDDDVKVEAAKVLEAIATRDDLPALRAALGRIKARAGGPFGAGDRAVGPLEAAIRNAERR